MPIEVRYEGGNKHLMEQWLGPDISFRPQGTGNLGKRMARSFRKALQAGMDRVVLVGNDVPVISPRILL
ncbi:MAG: DUF2064 domain-containing protein, partial [Deltaproteobacteria bacterium]|nr:DUF2064 domain-containing protein [Deltaproteobacteria bacterium]